MRSFCGSIPYFNEDHFSGGRPVNPSRALIIGASTIDANALEALRAVIIYVSCAQVSFVLRLRFLKRLPSFHSL